MKVKMPYGSTTDNERLVLAPGMLSLDVDNRIFRLHDGVTAGGLVLPTNRAVIPPYSGPGRDTTLKGNYTDGYFGEVGPADLIGASDLAGLTDVLQGNVVSGAGDWLKFALAGTVLFIAKKPIRYGISWDYLNQRDLIYGTREVVIGHHKYKIRLLQGGNRDPLPNNHSSYLADSEWNRLMYPISDTGPVTDAERWDSFTNNDLGFISSTQHSWCQEVYGGSPTQRLHRGSTSSVISAQFQTATVSNNGYSWRPVLELIPREEALYEAVEFYYQSDLELVPISQFTGGVADTFIRQQITGYASEGTLPISQFHGAVLDTFVRQQFQTYTSTGTLPVSRFQGEAIDTYVRQVIQTYLSTGPIPVANFQQIPSE